MTNDRDIERVLDQWFADGPRQLSDHVLADALERLRRQPQRRTWRLVWRDFVVSTPFKLAAAGAAVLLAILAGSMMLGPSPDRVGMVPSPSASASASPSPSVVPTPARSPTPTDACGKLGFVCTGSVPEGTVRTRLFSPAFEYTLPSPWFIKFDQPRGYGLVPDDEANMDSLRAGQYGVTALEVWNDLAIASADCREIEQPGVGRGAQEMASYLSDLDGLDADDPVPVEVGGLSGVIVDFAIAPDWTGTCPFSEGRPFVPTVMDAESTGGLHWGAVAGERYRFYLLEAPAGETVLIAVSTLPGHDFDTFLAAVEPVIESIRFLNG